MWVPTSWCSSASARAAETRAVGATSKSPLENITPVLLDAGGGDRRVVAEGPVLEFRCSASGPERLSRFDEVDRGDVEEEAEARGDVGKRPINRQVRIGQCRYGHVGAGHRRPSMSAGTTAASA